MTDNTRRSFTQRIQNAFEIEPLEGILFAVALLFWVSFITATVILWLRGDSGRAQGLSEASIAYTMFFVVMLRRTTFGRLIF